MKLRCDSTINVVSTGQYPPNSTGSNTGFSSAQAYQAGNQGGTPGSYGYQPQTAAYPPQQYAQPQQQYYRWVSVGGHAWLEIDFLMI